MTKLIISILSLLLYGVLSYGQPYMIRAFQPSHIYNQIPYGANKEAGRYVQADDAKIYYEVYGNGQPIVLLHGGLFGSIMEYADLIDKLKSNYQVIAIATRGHGKSEIGREPLTLLQRANDALAVINAVTKDSVTVIGFSDGGYSAYNLAALYPKKVKKMIVIGAGELKPGFRDFSITASQAIEMDKPFWEQQLKLMPEPNRLDDVFSQVAKCYSQVIISKDLLGKIKCPVMIIAGDKDEGNPIERVLTAARHISNHQIAIIPNTGHACHNDNFPAFWECVAPFLDAPKNNYYTLADDNLEAFQVSYVLKRVKNRPMIQVAKDSSVKSVDEPTFVKVKGTNFRDGEIEVKVLSKLLHTAPDFARGFIGIAFRISDDNSKFESIYIRPANGRSDQQIRRNHSIQYFSYPNFKFDRLRQESPEIYESYADMALNEWIKMKVVVKGTQAKLFLNDNNQPSLIVNDLKLGANTSGGIGLFVDIGTDGYFTDLKITNY
ncbi:MAG: alpha/beta hydrolase [Bacteroidetes bacterium]|nr:MAG: alpha/beta hydrolase [Bacteroidota bacterium]TAF94113.1 MAG: alpha/beta hydrolase [Bacteroidota bacterium]